MFFSQYKKAVGLAIYSLLAFHAAHSHAQINLSQSPLFLTSGAEPNLMFVLDDSGSMQFEITPETYRLASVTNGDTVFAFPSVNSVYGNNSYNKKVVAPGDRSVYGMLFRSPQINASYYNPAKLYKPWVKSDGITVTVMDPASVSCSLHNPINTGTGDAKCRKLTEEATRNFNGVDSTWTSCSLNAANAITCSTGTSNTWKYYPATYYVFNGDPNNKADVWNAQKYTERKIIASTTEYIGDGRGSERTDCALDGTIRTCKYAEEIQNFANWYTYYRSRVLTARAGIGRAFAQQQDGIRVGFGTINRGSNSVDGANTEIIKTGVRKFTSTRKASFLTELYGVAIGGGTPLPNALDYVGQYYQRSDNKGPWSKDPETGVNEAHVQCRASYALLMSDGYWTSTINTAGNSDNTAGSTITSDIPGANPGSYKYEPVAPFTDSQSNSLADVAMKYWKADLRTDLANKVKPNTIDPAFWQHMTTFTIGLGVEGNISVKSVADVITTGKDINGNAIKWPTLVTTAEDGTKVDDMLHAAVNGRGDFFSARDPDAFANSLANLLQDITGRDTNNAAAAAANSTSLNTGSMVYKALFDSNNWTGSLKAIEINSAGAFGKEVWSASIPKTSRKIYTFNGTTGVTLDWENLGVPQKFKDTSPSAPQQKDWFKDSSTSDATGEQRLNWFKGVDNNVANDPADLRNRDGRLLGDIVNSDPAFAGNTNLRYEQLPADLGAASYTDYFNTKKKNRREMLYVGANDGMLHGFNARVLTGDSIAAGAEVFAYTPTRVMKNIPNLASELYGKDSRKPHKYMVDGPIYVSDAYVGEKWRNILVGTLGAGGRGLYVLDVTNPDSFGEANVLFELTEDQYPELGFITGTPIVAPGADKRWKIFIGNGYNSTKDGSAKAYLGVIDINEEFDRAFKGTSVTRTKFIATNSTTNNSLSQPALLPNEDGLVVAAYAGDLDGNMWKFNLSSDKPGSWVVANSGSPLFVAKDTSSNTQPITASPTLGFNNRVTPARVMVYFGTGRYVASDDNQKSSRVQSFYALVDKEVAISGRTNLHQKTMTATSTQRTISGEINTDKTNAINWATKDGWYLDFPANERIITKPLLVYDRLIFPTVIPTDDPCSAGGSGWIMELIATGEPNPQFKLLAGGNSFQEIAIFGKLTSIEGSYRGTISGSGSSAAASTGSAASSSVGNECGGANGGGSGVFTAIGIQSDGSEKSNLGSRPCDLFDRQSWRELE